MSSTSTAVMTTAATNSSRASTGLTGGFNVGGVAGPVAKHLKIFGKLQIASIEFPRGWSEGFIEPYNGASRRSYSEVEYANDKQVAISFFFRGFPLREGVQAQNFQKLLEQEPRALTLKEMESIKEVLGDKNDWKVFNAISVRTENLNGKRVLIVEGRYKQQQKDVYHIFIDITGNGREIQEVFYQAARAKYFRHFEGAQQAFRSIKWK